MVAETKRAADEDVKRHVIEMLETLPTEDLTEVASFVDYQRHKAKQQAVDEKPRHPVALGGLWKGIRIDEEDIAAARRDMWAGVADDKE